MRQIFVRNRKVVSIGLWKPDTRELHAATLLKIGSESAAGEVDPDVLGFDEVHYAYFVHLDGNTYASFHLKDETEVSRGYLV